MLKFPKIEINIEKFYTIGVFCFGGVALFNTMGFVTRIMNDNFMLKSDMFSAALSLVFNYALFGFFSYLKSNLPPTDLKKGSLKDMEELLKA